VLISGAKTDVDELGIVLAQRRSCYAAREDCAGTGSIDEILRRRASQRNVANPIAAKAE